MRNIRIILGLGFVLYGLYLSIFGFGRGDAMALPFVVIMSGIGGVLLAPLIAERFSTVFDGLFLPNTRGDVKPELSRPRALMAERRYEEAATELRARLTEKPGQVEAQLLLANLLHENLGRPDEALALVDNALDADIWQSEHEKLVSIAVDILLERGERAAAVALLRLCAEKAGSTPAAAHMRERLQHLEQT